MSGENYSIELYAEEKPGISNYNNQLISANDNNNKLSSANALISPSDKLSVANQTINPNENIAPATFDLRKRIRESAPEFSGFRHVDDSAGQQHSRCTATATTDGKYEAAAAGPPAAKLRNQKKVGPNCDMSEYKQMLATTASFTVKSTGTKDRHSKVRTAKGLRDRRVRLSAPTAIQFFDVQDRLGYDQPSKAVDWLINKARAAIDELAPVEAVITTGLPETATSDHQTKEQGKQSQQQSTQIVHQQQQEIQFNPAAPARAESRAKARERARVRAAKVDRIDESCTNNESNSNNNSYELLTELLMKPTDGVGVGTGVDFRQTEFPHFGGRVAVAAATPTDPRLLSGNFVNQNHHHQINLLGGTFNNYLNHPQQHAAAAAAIFAAAAAVGPPPAPSNLQDLHMMAAAANFSPRGPLQSSFGISNNNDNSQYLNIISAPNSSCTTNTTTVSAASTTTISTSVSALSSCSSATASSSSALQPLLRHVSSSSTLNTTNNMNISMSNFNNSNSNASSFCSPSAASALYHHHLLHHHNGSTLPFSFYGPPPTSSTTAAASGPSSLFFPQQTSHFLINAIATPPTSTLRSILQHNSNFVELDVDQQPPDHSTGLPRTPSST